MKKRLLCPDLPQPGRPAVLPENEGHHATRVLRLRDGDIVEALDGKGKKALVRLRIRGVSPQLEWVDELSELIDQQSLSNSETSVPLVLEMSILKGSAMEWVIEKSVELGVKHFIPVITDYTVVQVRSKGPEAFQERWQKIADQALKQCNRLQKMVIASPITLPQMLTQKLSAQKLRLWCDEMSQNESPYLSHFLSSLKDPPEELRILIGPEGGWSPGERDLLLRESTFSPVQRIHLGPLTLRAETAALFSVSVTSALMS